MLLLQGDFQVARKYSRRLMSRQSLGQAAAPPSPTSASLQDSKEWPSDMPAMLQFPSNHPVNNWKRVKSHSFATLQALHIEVSVENNLQSLVAPDSSGTAPDSSYPSANAVIMYRIQVCLLVCMCVCVCACVFIPVYRIGCISQFIRRILSLFPGDVT